MKKYNIVGLTIGVALIVLGIYTAFGYSTSSSSQYVDSYTFGADFYTEIYRATQRAVYNLNVLDDNVECAVEFALRVLGLFIAAIGGLVVCHYGRKMEEEKNAEIQFTEKQEQAFALENLVDETTSVEDVFEDIYKDNKN